MIPLRADEPEYAKLADRTAETLNQYGNPIQLLPDGDNGTSLSINGDAGIGDNPNRTRQHAFHFTADNCIGCHACEAACSEKNDLPPRLSFRSVGYVEGGTYPDYTRINISMACNHCDDPVCLKGCPTRAYTKHPEYGAVLQDPDICFGCGYCTWVCPYNAPQLDPVAGQVEKCNMCVDRLEVGLKPACVSACVGNALDFGVVENVPERREAATTRIPGFPDPDITKANIRFQHLKTTPLEVTRPDSAPVKYRRQHDAAFRPVVDAKDGVDRQWNWRRLSSRENPLVAFTLAVQAAVGAFATTFLAGLGNSLIAVVALVLTGLGMAASTAHLGKTLRFYRGFNNLRHSNLTREALATVGFGVAAGIYAIADFAGWPRVALGSGAAAVVAGLATLYTMVRCYLIPARPFWNHWHTAASFVGASLALGGWIGLALVPGWPPTLVAAVLAGLGLEAVGLMGHARDMRDAAHEGAVSHYVQTTTFGYVYRLRNALLGGSLILVTDLALVGVTQPLPWLAAALAVVATGTVGRALFYVVVVPTTMPGAFFWKNKGFEEHARDIGLADNPAVGVAPNGH
ncbi:MAG: dimethyl sulfoxide reductase anchor subunit [Gammaproteobacteria bacterium]|nr:dimethyl sulfoxide reductase anchor subunit [Gammaproteobacteria bacterium]